MATLNEQLTVFIKSRGATLVGFADLKEIKSDAREGLPYGISIAVALEPQIMSGIKTGPTIAYRAEYKIVNALLNYLGENTAGFLSRKGFKAVSLAAAWGADKDTLSMKLPHKTVATRAGLGWIGKCNLFITKKYGSAIRLTTVLTDAPLAVGKPVNESLCAHCSRCVDACPAKAHTGKNWVVGMPREALYDAFKCLAKAKELSMNSFGEPMGICGLCIVACPWTKDYLKKS